MGGVWINIHLSLCPSRQIVGSYLIRYVLDKNNTYLDDFSFSILFILFILFKWLLYRFKLVYRGRPN